MNKNENSRFAGSQSETETQTQAQTATHGRPKTLDLGRWTLDSNACRDPRAPINPPSSIGHPVSACSQPGDSSSGLLSTLARPARSNPQLSTAFTLRKGRGFWLLTFDGQEAVFKHEHGAYYIHYLLKNPPAEPIHGLALNLAVNASASLPGGIIQIEDPFTGARSVVTACARIQEQSPAIEEAESAAALRRKQLELEAILDSDDTLDPERQEVTRELEAIYKYQKSNPTRATDAAQKAVRSVRMAIRRLHQNLAKSVDATGQPDKVLRAFADHIHRHVIIPSSRYSQPDGIFARAELAGRFTYEPPAGVIWS